MVAVAVLAAPFQADAASQVFVSLEYQILPGVTGCADASAFRTGVKNQLGYDPFRSQAERRVAVQVGRGEAGYQGLIHWTDAEGHDVGQRRLTTRRSGCADIVNNVAFAVAVQIQLLAALERPRSAPRVAASSSPRVAATPPPASSTPPSATADTPTAQRSPPIDETRPPEHRAPVAAEPATTVTSAQPPRARPASPLQLSIGGGPSLALALATHPTANGRLFIEARRHWLSFELALDASLPATQRDGGAAGFSLQRYAAAGAACGHGPIVGACVIGALDRLQASGLGVDMPLHPAGFAGQVGARIFARHDLGTRYFAALRVEGLVMLYRWTVVVNELPAWTTPRVGALIGADVGARFF